MSYYVRLRTDNHCPTLAFCLTINLTFVTMILPIEIFSIQEKVKNQKSEETIAMEEIEKKTKEEVGIQWEIFLYSLNFVIKMLGSWG